MALSGFVLLFCFSFVASPITSPLSAALAAGRNHDDADYQRMNSHTQRMNSHTQSVYHARHLQARFTDRPRDTHRPKNISFKKRHRHARPLRSRDSKKGATSKIHSSARSSNGSSARRKKSTEANSASSSYKPTRAMAGLPSEKRAELFGMASGEDDDDDYDDGATWFEMMSDPSREFDQRLNCLLVRAGILSPIKAANHEAPRRSLAAGWSDVLSGQDNDSTHDEDDEENRSIQYDDHYDDHDHNHDDDVDGSEPWYPSVPSLSDAMSDGPLSPFNSAFQAIPGLDFLPLLGGGIPIVGPLVSQAFNSPNVLWDIGQRPAQILFDAMGNSNLYFTPVRYGMQMLSSWMPLQILGGDATLSMTPEEPVLVGQRG
eukprot:Selendium_serpulae@DN3813_c0_g1_i2.p1